MAPDVARPELRAYLLGVLAEARADALEVRYVADPALVEAIRDEEDTLIADYLADRLTAVDRGQVERHYLASPVHRDRVAVARALADRAAAQVPRRAVTPAFYGWMATAAAVVLMSLWIAGRPGPSPRLATTPGPAMPPRPAAPSTPESTPESSLPSPSPTPVRAVFAIALAPIATRGSAGPTHRPPAGTTDLELRLAGAPVAGDGVYRIELQTVDGRVVWRGSARAAATGRGLLASVAVPLAGLAADDYVVAVQAGRDTRAEYVLRLRGPQR